MKKSRIILFVAFVIAIFAFMTACDNKNNGPVVISDTDFGGESFYFIGSFITGDPRDNEVVSALTGEDVDNSGYIDSAEGKAMFDHCAAVEAKYNCKIVRYDYTYASNANFAAAFAAGEAKADFINMDFNSLLDLYKAEVLADLHSIKTINADDYEKWGGESRREATTYHGILYAFPVRGSLYCPIQEQYNAAFACNNDVYNIFGVDTTPREMIEAGDWTFDGFGALLRQVYSADDDNPIYGLGLVNSLATAAIYANGGNCVVKYRGKYVFGYTQPSAIRALEWAKGISSVTGMVSAADMSQFDKGMATFMLVNSTSIMNSQLTNVSWLPFPYGPDVKYGTSTAAYFGYHETGLAVFNHENDPSRVQTVGTVVNALFDPTEEYGKDGYGALLARWYFETDEDYEVYANNCKTMNYDWSKEYLSMPTEDIQAFQGNVELAIKKTGNVQALMDACEATINEKVCAELNGEGTKK